MARPQTKSSVSRRRFSTDQAVIAVLIEAMDANEHVSPAEAERAHHVIWSMRRFRARSADAVNRLIGRVREQMEERGKASVLEEAVRALPAALRKPVFAVAVDVMLVDSILEKPEREFVRKLAERLKIAPAAADGIVKVLRIKNGA